MHKIRNTKHLKILNSMVGTVAPGQAEPLSKKILRKLLQAHKWDKKATMEEIEKDEWWYRFVDD